MSAELADRQDSSAGDTLRVSALRMAEQPESIGRYKVLSELGRGAMARVYLALDPNIHRKVALKVLEPRGLVSTIDMDELRTRFLLEARAAGNLRHPSAVAIYDADHDPETGLSFIAMEWVDGESLDHRLREGAPLPADQAVHIVCQMAGALDAAHQQGLIHRDVKPANILLDRQGNAKLSDFGIAKVDSLELTSTGQVLGTPFYMSPEQIRDEELDGRSDLFSLGVVLYQCLTGQQPFHAGSLPALTHKILHVDPSPPQALNSELPPRLASTTLRALEKDPKDRFQSGARFAEALGRGTPIPATQKLTNPSFVAHEKAGEATDPARGRNWWRLGAGILLALVTTAILVSIWRPTPSHEPVLGKESTIATTPLPVANPPDAVSSADRARSPAGVTSSTLQISYTNRLKSATLEVWVDGSPVLTRTLYGPRGILKRTVGRTFLESIPVSAGHHDVRVSIRGSAGKIEASNWTGTSFDSGQTRRLRAELIPPSYLNLSWK